MRAGEPVKHEFSRDELARILQSYNLGRLVHFEPFQEGTVQTNIAIATTAGRYAFRYYESRSRESALFEIELLTFLKAHSFPCPAPYADNSGEYIGTYKRKPYAIFEFVDGHHVPQPNETQFQQLIQKAAELHTLTEHYVPIHRESRWNYNADFCLEMARKASQRTNTDSCLEKLSWLEGELQALDLPPSLPNGICHADFNLSNVLFTGNEFRALLDFDDANYTYLIYDLVGLIESHAWRHDKDKTLNLQEAKEVVVEYARWRPLSDIEKRHLFDVYKLSILIDCVWYFDRGDAANFYEKTKIDFLNGLGRDRFYHALFD